MNFSHKKKILVAIMALLVGVSLVAGCGGKKEEAKGTDIQGTVTSQADSARPGSIEVGFFLARLRCDFQRRSCV